MNRMKNEKGKPAWFSSLSVALGLAFALGVGVLGSGVLTDRVEANGSPFIYDNGGLATGATSNSGASAPSGTQWSEAQNETGNTTYSNTLAGVSCSVTATQFRCADDFTVPSGQTWTISQVVTYAYQTGFAGTTSPVTGATLQIWSGRPGDSGSTVIFGDTSTNRLGSSTDSSLFRIFNSAVPAPGSTPATNRRIWQNNINVSPAQVLSAGTYWVDFQTQIGATTAHFAPPVTIPGVRSQPGMNARQFTGTAWQDVIDVGNPDASAPDVPLDFPFKLVGSIAGGPSAQAPQIDFDGDGESDYSIVRNITPGLADGSSIPGTRRSIQEQMKSPGFRPADTGANSAAPSNHGTNLGWYIHNSGSNTARVQGHGQPATDFWVPEDYDGDGKDDIAVWRGVAASGPGGGFFYTYTSSDNTVNEIDFGVQGDNPTVVGDYDGDGKADPAVFRCPSGGGQCTFFYRGSLNNPSGAITYIPWGNNSSAFIRPYPGDFDGDGKNDVCISQGGQYILRRSSDSGVEYISWGLPTDPTIAPGDYDGDGKTDFMNVRVNGSAVEWWLRTRTNVQSTRTWGALVPGFSEFATPGDFDGDGKTDLSIWRRDNSSNTNSFFYTLRSSDGMLEGFQWGSMGDSPVPGWNAN